MQIIVTGSLAFDQIMNFPESFADYLMPEKLHVLSVSFLVDHLHKNFGGVAGNICYNLGLLGKTPICLACAGKDAEDYKIFLEKNGVNVDYMHMVSTDYTGSFVVMTDSKDCQIAGFYPGAMRHDGDLKLSSIIGKENPKDFFLIIAPTMPAAMTSFIRQAQDIGIRYLFAPAQQIPRLDDQTLRMGIKGAEILLGNDYELGLIEKQLKMSKEEMQAMVEVVVTTLGERGSTIEQKEAAQLAIGVAKPREVKDPTGSGDAYIAGFISSYLDGKTLVECGQVGATAAVYAVEQYGTTGHSYSLALFENRLKENFG